MLKNKIVLITGGTGSFGQKFTEIVLRSCNVKKLIVFSRDEFKQYKMKERFPEEKYPIRYFLGDVRDQNRLRRAFDGVDYVVHAAALKQVPALEYNPTEAVNTNVVGSENVVNAAIDAGVEKVIAISTDKAVNPINLYGATKLVAEKIFIGANAYAGGRIPFSVVRYGNVIGSRGSIVPYFRELTDKGCKRLPITDERMTRFWITLEEGVDLVLTAIQEGVGGEIFVPRLPSLKITDLAKAINQKAEFDMIGIRPGEKIHETLISEDESRQVITYKNMYVIMPLFAAQEKVFEKYKACAPVVESFSYRSDNNPQWLTSDEIAALLRKV